MAGRNRPAYYYFFFFIKPSSQLIHAHVIREDNPLFQFSPLATLSQACICVSISAAAGCGKGNDSFSGKIMFFQECVNNRWCFSPPDRETKCDYIVVSHVVPYTGSFRTARRILHFFAAARFRIPPVQIFLRIVFLWFNLKNVSPNGFSQPFCDSGCCTGRAEIRYQCFHFQSYLSFFRIYSAAIICFYNYILWLPSGQKYFIYNKT